MNNYLTKKLDDKLPKKCCNIGLHYHDSKNSTIDYKAVRATCGSCDKSYEQNLMTNAVYVTNGNQFTHLNCGEEIDCVWRLHSLWDKRFDCAGSGEVDKYPIPFCPKHEEKPSTQGMPVYY